MTEWNLVNRSELTEEERQMERELCEEERMDREKAFWDIGLDPERNNVDYGEDW